MLIIFYTEIDTVISPNNTYVDESSKGLKSCPLNEQELHVVSKEQTTHSLFLNKLLSFAGKKLIC